jgi:amidohydrolase
MARQAPVARKDLKERVCEAVDRRRDSLVQLNHDVHATPEVAFQEWKSSARIADAAESGGLKVQRAAFGMETALSAEFGEGNMTVALLSEYDALPGIGHACGHNVIATAGLGAALALHDLGPNLPGRIRWLGTPAEEQGCGKEIMARHSAFEGVAAAMMVHPAGIEAKGFCAACLSQLDAVFLGQSAHPAVNPSDGRNALDAVVASYQAIAALRQHIAAGDQINAVIAEGGRAANVIPDRAILRSMARAPSAQRLTALKRRIDDCIRAGAMAAGCSVDIRWGDADYLDFKINEPLADAYQRNASILGREGFIAVEKLPAVGGDIGNISHRVPTLHALICCAPRHVRLHDPAFANWARSERGDKAAIDGAKALAMTVIDYFTDGELRAGAASAFALHAEESTAAVAAAWRVKVGNNPTEVEMMVELPT